MTTSDSPRVGKCENCGVTILARKRGPAPTVCEDHKAERKRIRENARRTPKPNRTVRPERRKYKPGQRFGNLTLVHYIEHDSSRSRALFACDCGTVKALALGNVTSGATSNCADRTQHPDPRVRDVVGYARAHERLRKARGDASNYDCAALDCTVRASHWAYLHGSTSPLSEAEKRDSGPYVLDATMYAPYCRHHHQLWDRAHRAQTNGDAAGVSLAHVTLWEATHA